MSQHTIISLTINPAIDKSTSVDRVVADRKLRCSRPRRESGGGGINVSRAVHRLGGRSLALYVAGGATGDILKRLVDREGFDHRAIEIEAWTRENLMVFESSTEQQFRFTMPGPELTEAECNRCLGEVEKAIDGAAYLVASGSLPPGVPDDYYARLADVARRKSVRFVADASGPALEHLVQAGAYLLKPNLREMEQLTGVAMESEEQQVRAARKLINGKACEVVVLSMGASGALLVTRDDCHHVRSPAVPIRSRVGAGDSMVAAMVLGLDRGWNLPDAVRFGVAAGAAAVMTPGSELCRREDTERLFEQMSESQPA